MHIDTPRLSIIPLTEKQLLLYAANNGSLEKELGITYAPKDLDAELIDTLESHFLRLVPLHPEQFFYYTLWSIILKEKQVLVGDLCFKGAPDEEGTVEVGYGTYPEYQKQGIMSEAISALIQWCSTRPEITCVIAETEIGNTASERVLERNSFHLDCQGQDNRWWRLDVKNLNK